MTMQITLQKDSTFNDKEHFIYCLHDLVNEWEDIIGPKEMDKEDVGFNSERLLELKTILNKLAKEKEQQHDKRNTI